MSHYFEDYFKVKDSIKFIFTKFEDS